MLFFVAKYDKILIEGDDKSTDQKGERELQGPLRIL